MPDEALRSQLGAALLSHARTAIAARLGIAAPPASEHARLDEAGASFVTLTRHGALRGCMGQLEASRSLREDVRANALAAAFRDPRFAPLTEEEWPALHVEVSLLGPVSFTACASEDDCLRLIQPGEDGVILASGCHHATFLPQVWEQLPEARDFIARLCEKAGLHAYRWPTDMQVGRYRVDKFKEAESP